MRLSLHDNADGTPYWYASTDDGGYDADGPDPLTAVTRLTEVLEHEVVLARPR